RPTMARTPRGRSSGRSTTAAPPATPLPPPPRSASRRATMRRRSRTSPPPRGSISARRPPPRRPPPPPLPATRPRPTPPRGTPPVAITAGTFAGDGDVLGFNTAGTAIAASYNSTTETLTLSGADTVAHYSQVLDSVTFSSGANPSNSGSNPSRILSWTVNDG